MSDTPQKFDIVFLGPPGPNTMDNTCEFVDIEDMDGKSIKVGEWLEREDGYWVLRIDMTPDVGPVVPSSAQAALDHWSDNKDAPEYQPDEEDNDG